MRNRTLIHQDTDTTLWGGAAMVLSLFAWIGASDVVMQAMIGILFPCIGWAVLYFVKREIIYRFPQKEPKQDEKLEEDKGNNRKELK